MISENHIWIHACTTQWRCTGNFLQDGIPLVTFVGSEITSQNYSRHTKKIITNHETSCTTVVLPARQNPCYAYYSLKKINSQEVIPVRVTCTGVEF